MTVALQVFGGLILAAALLQAGVGLISQFAGALRGRKMDQRRLNYFNAQTEHFLKQAEADRERTELTWSGKRKFRIAERRVESKDGAVCSFVLAPHDGGKLPSFHPGQFLTFELAIPDQPVPVIRCYSLSDSPMNHDTYRVSIKRLGPPPGAEPGTPAGLSSGFFHDSLKEGDVLDVMAPNGGFYLKTQSERPIVLIGGGVGLTPILSMLKWLSDTGSHREVWLFYCVKNGDEVALRDEIDAIVRNNNHFHSIYLYSEPTEKCVEGEDFDCPGYLSINVLKNYLSSSNYEFYICGPPPMMESVTNQLGEWGVPQDDIHTEAFGPASVKKIAKPETGLEGDVHSGCKVDFTKSGKSLVWTAQSGTLLDLAESNGIKISSGCRAGNCGTCVTALKDGKVSYITRPASRLEKGSTLVCVACPDGDVAIDA